MTTLTNSILCNSIKIKEVPNENDDGINKKYIDENFIKIKNIPSENLKPFNFSYRDIANDVLLLEKRLKDNFYIKAYMSIDPPPQIIKERNLEYTLNIPYRVFITICRNFVNDPNYPPPPGFFKRSTVVNSDGEILLDVITYKDDEQGNLLELNYDRDICYMNFQMNIRNSNSNPPINELNMKYPDSNVNRFNSNQVIFNPNNIDIYSLENDSNGLEIKNQSVIVLTNRTYHYPSSESNDNILIPTGEIDSSGNSTKKAIKYFLYPNIGGRREIVQAICQGWGWTTRNSNMYKDLPGFYVAKDMDLVTNGFKVVLRVSYHKYI